MKRTTHREYDAIVVGSGAGGAAAAYRLARAGLDVLLIEKGTQLPSDGSTLDIRRVVTNGEFLSREQWLDGAGNALRPEEHFNLGGKTKWYGAALIRYAPHEFEADTQHGCLGWPISYEDLEPYYTEAERLLGVRNFECEPDLKRILRGLRGSGGWRTEPLPMGLSPAIMEDAHEAAHFDGFASVRDLKADAQTAFLARGGGASRLSILTGTEVTALLESTHNARRVAGVRTADGRTYGARATLLAAGALHSPR
ncbi:MAG TPA: FAD-dependent oxidoreductase, partial [Steroidobacteraceae bacterium]|nr:FAD-dependent oxidoreductase [Steroidobacteraceae bacterium]